MKTFYFIVLLTTISMTAFNQVRVGDQAPEISLPGIDGNIIHLSDLKGKIVLIDFWASWCGPCRKNNPHLLRFYKKYHPKGVEILGISIDNNEESWKKAIEHDKLNWLQVNDNHGWDAGTALAYNVDAIPASFLIDQDGVVRAIDKVGAELEAAIKELQKK